MVLLVVVPPRSPDLPPQRKPSRRSATPCPAHPIAPAFLYVCIFLGYLARLFIPFSQLPPVSGRSSDLRGSHPPNRTPATRATRVVHARSGAPTVDLAQRIAETRPAAPSERASIRDAGGDHHTGQFRKRTRITCLTRACANVRPTPSTTTTRALCAASQSSSRGRARWEAGWPRAPVPRHLWRLRRSDRRSW
jgi:hypothetical protein